jgi:predicted nucleotidyltransferase component of viral defense system
MRERGDDVQHGLQRYARERFLYRLGESKHRSRFVLKGATLFALWGGALYRATRDLDFTGYGSAEPADILAALRDVCAFPSPDDAIVFDETTFSAEAIRDEGEYRGLRIRFEARLGDSSIPMQIDIGFGNAIHPEALESVFPTLLGDPAPQIRSYPPEAVIAEKLHGIVALGERNSRLKDFYDLWTLARHFSFEGTSLAAAVTATFNRRDTAIGAEIPAGLSSRFFADADRAVQWRRYVDQNALPGASGDFAVVGEQI